VRVGHVTLSAGMEELADILEAHQSALLTRWIAVVGESLAPGPRTTAELTDHMPQFVRHVIAALREPGRDPEHSPIDGQSEIGQAHGAQRFRQGFELEAVVREYGVLVHLVLDLIEETDASVSSRDVRKMVDLVTNAVAEATAEHARRQAALAEQALTKELRFSREIERLNAQLATTLLSMGDGVLATDAEGAVTLLNPAAERLTGWSAEAALGKPAEAVVPLIDQVSGAPIATPFADVLRGGEATSLGASTLLSRRDGSTLAFADSLSAIRDGAGVVVGAVLVFRDETEARRIEAKLHEARTFEQHLVGIVSHDLRNPLGAILMGASILLEMDELSERATSIARRIHSSAERSARMIRDLLDFTQARLGGGIRLDRRPSDVCVITSATLDEVRTAYPERTLELTHEGDVEGNFDADRLAQLVTNLAANALKYGRAGTPVSVHVTGSAHGVELTLHNHGEPIPGELLGRIFEPLQRATSQIDRRTRSVGLGLYIVDAIARAHGGSVSVCSTEQGGTTFTVRLPKHTADHDE